MPTTAHAHGELLIRIAAASREIATNPLPSLYLNRGELYREDRNWDAAEADYCHAAELGVAIDEVDLCRAQLKIDQNQISAAKTILEKIIVRSPLNGKALLARARVSVKRNDPQGALCDFQRASTRGARLDSLAWLEWAQALVAVKRPAEALAVLDRGIQETGAVSSLQVYAVDLELARNNSEKALSRLQTIIDKAERKERWLVRRGDIQMAAGDQLSARESYAAATAAIKRLPKILQVSPAMLTLKTQIDGALAGITDSPAISKVGVR